MRIHKRLLDQWQREWNYSEEFWCITSMEGVTLMANSSFKEWFEICFGISLVGHNSRTKLHEKDLQWHEDWQVFYRHAPITNTLTRNDMKLVRDDGEFIGLISKVTYCDLSDTEINLDLAQKRLNHYYGVDHESNESTVVQANFGGSL